MPGRGITRALAKRLGVLEARKAPEKPVQAPQWEDATAAMAARKPDIRMDLTQPPSFNDCWCAGLNSRTGQPGIFKTTAYRRWANAALSEVMFQVPQGRRISGLYGMRLVVPNSLRDGDNNVKPVPDALQRGGAVANDKNVRRLVLDVDPTMRPGLVTVELWALETAPAKASAGAIPHKEEAPRTPVPSAS